MNTTSTSHENSEKMSNITTNPVNSKTTSILSQSQDSSDKMLDILNVFLKYYNTTVKENSSMFDDIDFNKEESTNDKMEVFYDAMVKYKNYEKDDDIVAIYDLSDVDQNKCSILYCLKIDDRNYACQFLIPLLSYLSDIDWKKKVWEIKKLKDLSI